MASSHTYTKRWWSKGPVAQHAHRRRGCPCSPSTPSPRHPAIAAQRFDQVNELAGTRPSPREAHRARAGQTRSRPSCVPLTDQRFLRIARWPFTSQDRDAPTDLQLFGGTSASDTDRHGDEGGLSSWHCAGPAIRIGAALRGLGPSELPRRLVDPCWLQPVCRGCAAWNVEARSAGLGLQDTAAPRSPVGGSDQVA
jgi:hypothetical protein